MVRSHQGVDPISLEDPKQTGSLCCQEPRCGPDVHSSPSHGAEHQLFGAAPPTSAPRVKGGKPATSGAPSPFGLLARGWWGGQLPYPLSPLWGATWFHAGDSHLGLTCGLISSPLPAG